MNDARVEVQKERVGKLVERWKHDLWLGHWRIDLEWHRSSLPPLEGESTAEGWETLFRCSVQ